MYFDRFDICEAFNLLAHDYGLYDVKARLDAIPFKCAHSAEFYDGLSDNGKAIYDTHAFALDNGASTIKTHYA